MIVFLFRPCPQIPQPSLRAARECFEASRFNIDMHSDQISEKSVDLTWIFTQSMFMALNAMLWSLSYPEIRNENPRVDVQSYLQTAQDAIFRASERWPGVCSALALYESLIHACLKAYDQNDETSNGVGSPSSRVSPESTQNLSTPPILPMPWTVPRKHVSATIHQDLNHAPQFDYVFEHNNPPYSNSSPARPAFIRPESQESTQLQDYSSAPTLRSSISFPETSFDSSSPYNALPSPHIPYQGLPTSQPTFSIPYHDQSYYLGSIGDQYSQYLSSQYLPRQTLDSLDLEQQTELMNTLENDGWSDIGLPLDQSTVTFNGASYSV